MQQGSVEYLHIHLGGDDTGSLTADRIEVAVYPPSGVRTWLSVDSYDPSTATAKALFGPGTPRGPLPLGQVLVQAEITDYPEVIITPPALIYVYP
jgi:hypothetical protein